MPIKPAKAIRQQEFQHAGIGAPLSEVNPKGRDLLPANAERQPRLCAWLPPGPTMKNPRAPEDTRRVFHGFHLLARLLHLSQNFRGRGFVPAGEISAVPLLPETVRAETIAKPWRCLLNSS